VVWTSDDLSLSHRRGKAPCALADWDPVERPFVGSQAQSSAALAIDAGDHLHVAWAGRGYGANPGVSNIQYLGRVGAIWSSREPVTDLPGAQAAPSIAVDRAGHVHLAWAGLGWGTHAASINIQHGVRTAANAWAIDGVTDQPTDQSGPSLALDAGDNAYVSWLGDLGAALITTQFSQRQAGAWLPPVILEPLGTGRSATLSWASHPVVGGQRTNVPAIGCVCAYSFVATGPAVPVLNFYGDCGGPHG
jgi:hypothetical protein